MNKATLITLDSFRVKMPEVNSAERDVVFNFLFDEFKARWAGKVGHYHQSNIKCQIAPKQNGYLYVFKQDDKFLVTAHCTLGPFKEDTLEITLKEITDMAELTEA